MNILHAVHSCGEYDRLMQGIFENYPTIKFKDSYMSAVSRLLKLNEVVLAIISNGLQRCVLAWT